MSNSDQNQDPNTEKIPESLAEVQALLKTKAKELYLCQPQQVPGIQQEIQRLRIVASIFREVEENQPDGDLYKEMNLLNRMMVGKDLEADAIRREANDSVSKARTLLEQNYGVNKASANRIARVIGTVVGRNEVGLDGDEPEPEPIGPAGIN